MDDRDQNKITPVEFKWGDTMDSVGVIAQEVESVLPEVVAENDTGLKTVAYGNIVSLLIEAIKEQQKEIDAIKINFIKE